MEFQNPPAANPKIELFDRTNAHPQNTFEFQENTEKATTFLTDQESLNPFETFKNPVD